MDDMNSSICEHKDGNGFVTTEFHVSLDVEKEAGIMRIQDPEQGDGPGPGPGPGPVPCSRLTREKVDISRRPKNTGIWKILNRRKPPPGCERRPHSMILPGEASVPKLSFVDKMRSLKKLKSPTVFKGKAAKLSNAKPNTSLEEAPEDESFCKDDSSHMYIQRNLFKSRVKRHSYAGCTKDFDYSFEEVDSVSTSENVPRDLSSKQNGCKSQENLSYTKKDHSNFSNCNNMGGHEEYYLRDCPKTPQSGRKSKGSDVWSYLRKISFIGKGSSHNLEKSFDSEFHTFDKTVDSDCASADFECIKDYSFTSKPTGVDNKGGHFGGILRFFSNVAETARKWRNSSRSFSPPEGEQIPLGSPGTQRSGGHVHSMSLNLRNEAKTTFPTPLSVLSTDSGLCETLSPTSVTGHGSPRVVLKSWKSCPEPPSPNGYLNRCNYVVSIENDIGHANSESTVFHETQTQLDICLPEEECDLGNDMDSISTSLSSDQKQGDDETRTAQTEETCLHENTRSHSFGKALKKPLSRPPDPCPLDTPFKAALQRCRSLPLPQSSPSGLDQTDWRYMLPAEATLKTGGVMPGGRHLSTCGRRLMRPASEELHINTV
ncbi:hypothetical protein JZ751_024286, partial [Albula glossodonta]